MNSNISSTSSEQDDLLSPNVFQKVLDLTSPERKLETSIMNLEPDPEQSGTPIRSFPEMEISGHHEINEFYQPRLSLQEQEAEGIVEDPDSLVDDDDLEIYWISIII